MILKSQGNVVSMFDDIMEENVGPFVCSEKSKLLTFMTWMRLTLTKKKVDKYMNFC